MDDKVVQQYGDTGNGILIRLPQSGPEQGASLEQGAEQVVSTLESSGLGEFEVISRELVGPVIGQELQQRGISAFVFAMAGILIYVGLRFRFSFGVGAIVAVAHDILVTLSLLTMFGYELSLNVVAAMLTITGYSVNDSIVVFDRVRENLRAMRRDKFDQLVNTSINQTLARTIITSGTTGFAVLALYLFGGEVLRGFAFTMLVGVLSGTYSTIFIATSVAIAITQGRAARQRQAMSPSERAPEPPKKAARSQRSRRQGRKARAS
jgi:preprotein translocase subunit SecF